MTKPIDFSLYLITDRQLVADGYTLLTAVKAALDAGVKAVQLREKDLCAAELLSLADELRNLTLQYDALLLINDRIDVALAADADGVHLGGHSLPIDQARKLLGSDRLIGVSTHSPEEVYQATIQGADFVTFGPVYETPSKAAYGSPQGLQSLTDVCHQSAIPVFALGGITSQRQQDVMQAGAHGVALISAILAASDPAAATYDFNHL
jgi:thiamine-phosphate pyrophosphorylase